MDGSKRRPLRITPVDGAIAFVLLALAVLPFAARAAASDPGPPPAGTNGLLPLRTAPTATLRDVPVFTVDGAAERAVDGAGVLTDGDLMAGAVEDASTALLPSGGGDSELIGMVGDAALTTTMFDPEILAADRLPDPYRHPAADDLLDRILPGALDAAAAASANDLAGLLVLAADRFPGRFPNGAAVAYELLERAQVAGGCDAALNMAALLSMDSLPWDDDVAAAFERAALACPGEATPLWLLGEYQGHLAFATENDRLSLPASLSGDPRRTERLRRPVDTFGRLQRAYPGSPAGWSGEADLELQLATAEDRAEPFTARARYRRAVDLYRRARELSSDPGLAAGEARAHAGLRRFDLAVATQGEALAETPDSAVFQTGLLAYLEGQRRFDLAAEAAAASLHGSFDLPPGRGLFPVGFGEALGVQVPLSLGAERLSSTLLEVVSQGGRGAGAGVEDLSFIPAFRAMPGLTDTSAWCRDWSRRRDLVLAGRPTEALPGFAPTFPYDGSGPLHGHACFPDTHLLEAVARAESGDLAGARDVVTLATEQGWFNLEPFAGSNDPASALVQDARQNLWRSAGDPAKAADVAAAWLASDPDDPLAMSRLGEAEFLTGRMDEAAQHFWAAAERWVGPSLGPADAGDTAAAAMDRVRLGTILDHEGKPDDALRQLSAADALAIAALETAGPFDGSRQLALTASYFARSRSGDVELRRRRYDRAEAHYQGAQKRLDELRADAETFAMGLVLPEVLQNNQALAQIRLGRPKSALRLATAALRADPGSPIFLQTQAFAQQVGGDLEGAARSYRAAIAADPTLFPAMNDLGAIRALQGRNAEAAGWFRSAIAVDRGFATAWYNLGVVRSRMGPAGLLEAQGALARAASIDRSFRDADREVVFDQDLYFTTLDLSKPLPPEWRFAKSEGRAPLGISVLLVVLLLGRLGWSVARDRAGAKGLERFSDLTRRPRLGWLAWLIHPVGVWLGVTASLLVLLWPLARAGGASVTEGLILAAGLLGMVMLYLRARAKAAAGAVDHYTWGPAVAFGTLAMFVGFAWAPLPVSKRDEGAPVPWAGTVALGGMTLLFLLMGTLSQVPVTRALGVAGLVLTASAVSPIPPYDGAALDKRLAVALDVVFLGIAVLLFFGVL
jgi:cellulose synthase operon protein C